jgi:hypothetical protein
VNVQDSPLREKPSSPPPIICVNDRVLLAYAILDDSVGFNPGHGLLFVEGKEIGRVPCLAISQDKDSDKVMLYFCNWDWSLLGIAAQDSVTEAKKKAERIYPGLSRCWTDARFSEEDVARHRDNDFSEIRCSFCGKRPDETLAVTFQSGSARICGNCIAEFYRELTEGAESHS